MVANIVKQPWYKTEKGKTHARMYYLKNRDLVIRRSKEWIKKNPSKRKEILARFADHHRSEERERSRRRHKENPKRTLDRLKKWQRRARITRPEFVAKTRMRCRLRAAFQRGYGKKIGSTLELVGCSWEQLRRHIENQFHNGMSWERIREIDIDHIIPCSVFDLTDPRQQKACFHFTNLQPMWKQDNRRKGAKVITNQFNLL